MAKKSQQAKVECAVCKRLFEVEPSRVGKSKYCNTRCRGKGVMAIRQEKLKNEALPAVE